MHLIVLGALCLLLPLALRCASADEALYQPKGQASWDYWFATDRGTYYAFYLQAPLDHPNRGAVSTVGLATSRDLLRWTEVGEVLRANPRGQWNDQCIATGSVFRHGAEWLMVFTAVGKDGGIGLARSKDLRTWSKVGPVTFRNTVFEVPDVPYWRSKGFAASAKLHYTILADCYVLPELLDGWHYMVANAVIDGEPDDKRGCSALLRSRDGHDWEGWGMLAAPREFDRLETQQLWRHGGRWYLYFGAAREKPVYRANLLYTARSMRGPYEPAPGSIALPDGRWYYIAKVIAGPDGKDHLMACVDGTKLSLPYPVIYGDDGGVTIGKRAD